MARYRIGGIEAAYHLVRVTDLHVNDYLYTHSKTWRTAHVVTDVRITDQPIVEIDVKLGPDGHDGVATLSIHRDQRLAVLRRKTD